MFKRYGFWLLFGVAVQAQNTADIKKITSSAHPSVKEVGRQLYQEVAAKEQRVLTFLQANPQFERTYMSDGVKYQIADVVEGRPLYRSTDNANAAKAIKTNRLYPGGAAGLALEGDGLTLGVWDGGWVLRMHNEFVTNGVSKVTCPDAPSATPEADGHGTHVAGTVAAKGAVANAKGMAPKAILKSYDWGSDITEVYNEVITNGLLLSNHSYGVPIISNGQVNVPSWYPGCYNSDASSWDALFYTNPYYLEVTSAGNSGADSYNGGLAPGYDKLTGEKNSKNNLVVANANPTTHPITGNLTALVINVSSSQGPSDDGRIKPDIAADGTNLYSSYSTANNSYEVLSGTSMASPGVMGSCALLQQHYRNLYPTYMRSTTLKGLVCHTAVDDTESIGPDPKFGWGLMDSQAAADVITKSTTNQSIILESTLNEGGEYVYTFTSTGTAPIKATLCWLDPPGSPRNGITNDPTPALMNDLDLRITHADATYFPWKLDLANITEGAIKGDNLVDNVERVDVDQAEAGTYTLRISHKGTLSGGNQPYSLILSGANLVLDTKKNEANVLGVWPNPATSLLNVTVADSNDNWTAGIVDVQGRLLSSRTISPVDMQGNTFSLDVSQLPAGVYIVNLSNGKGAVSKKFIKN